MKKLSRILIPLLVLSVVLCCFVAITSAEDAETTYAFKVSFLDANGEIDTSKEAKYYDAGTDFTAIKEHGSLTDTGNNIYTVSNLQVDLLSDVAWNEIYSIQTKGKFILNLNGFTLYMNGYLNSTKLGRFQLVGTSANHADTVFTVNGRADDGEVNGSIVTSEKTTRVITRGASNQYLTINFNNVDFRSTTKEDFYFFELQSSHTYFNNCNLYDTGFGMSTGGYHYHSRLEFDGCTINSGNHAAVFQLGKSDDGRTPTTVVFKNGTVNSTANYLVNVKTGASPSNGSVIKDPGDNRTEGVTARSVTITDSLINMPTSNLANCLNNDVKTTITLGLNTRVVLAADPQNTDKIIVATPAGSVYAQCGPNKNEYKIVNEGDAVTVNFYNITDEGAEFIDTRTMLKGVAPCIVDQLALAAGLYFDGDVLKKFGGWKDAEGNLVTTLTENVDLYRVADDVAYYATFSSDAPSLDSIVHAEFEDNNINNCFVSPVVLVQLYADCINDAGTVEKMITMPGAMTIDLGNHVLTHGSDKSHANSALRPANSAATKGTLTVKNGTVNLDKSIFLYPRLSNSGAIVVTDVIFNMTGNATLLQAEVNGNGANYTFTNVTVNVNNGGTTSKNNVFNIDRSSSSTSSTYVFDNLTVRSDDGTKVNNVFENNKNKPDHILNFTIKNSTIDIPLADGGQIFHFYNTASTKITVENTDFNTHGTGKIFNLASNPNATININGIDMDRAEAWTGSAMPEATVKLDGETGEAVVAFGANADLPYTPALKSQIATVTWIILDKTYTYTYVAGITPDFYGVATNEDATRKYACVTDAAWIKDNVATTVAGDKVTYTPGTVSIGYAVTDEAGNILSYSLANTLDETVFTTLGDGETLTFYKDIVFATATSGNLDIKFGAGTHTLDLNTWSLDLTGSDSIYYRFVLTNDVTFNVKNGTIVNDHNVFYSQLSSVANLNKLTVQVTADRAAIDYRMGELNATDCTIYSADGGNLIDIGYRGGTVNMTFTACHLTAGANVFRLSPVDDTQEGTYTVNFNGGSITARDAIFYIEKTSNEGNIVNMSFGGGIKINVASGKYFNLASYDITDTFTFTDCWLNAEPNTYVEETVKPNVVYGDGMTLRSTTHDTYKYRLTDYKPEVNVNLTLFSDFNLNLFIKSDKGVLAVYADGKPLHLENSNDSVKAALSGISADRAAERVVFTIVYKDGEYGVKLTRDYSILNYASALLAGNYSPESKQLVASIVRYIDAAYAYGGKQNDDLTSFLTDNPGYLEAIPTAEALPDLNKLESDAEYKDLAIAINSAQLALSGDQKYILNLNESYTGTLTVNGESYSVTNGQYNGKSYVVIKLAAKDYLNGFTVTATVDDGDVVIGNYDLVAYAVNMKSTSGTLDDLLANLIAYVTEAKAYADFVADNGLN